MFDPRLTLAYLAGCIDSDGCIGIKKSTYSVRVTGDSRNPTYSERVELYQVTPEVPFLLKETFGGSVSAKTQSTDRGRPLCGWRATDKRAAHAIRQMLPYLRIEREQALNCLDLREVKEKSKRERVAKGRGHRGSAPRSAKMSRTMERLYQNAKVLNTIGAARTEEVS